MALLQSNGRGGETRTPGLLVPNQARYQLRHTPWCEYPRISDRTKTLSGALCLPSESLGSAADGLNVAMVEVADFGTVHELDAVTQPIEAIRQDDFALGASRGTVNIHGGAHLVAIAQIDLALVWSGECMGLPKRHVSIIAGK